MASYAQYITQYLIDVKRTFEAWLLIHITVYSF